MIDTAEQTICKACGKPLEQASRRGPHIREYCNATCRQRGHRQKKAPTTIVISQPVTMDTARIAELEQELASALLGRDQMQERFVEYVRTTNEKLGKLAEELAKSQKYADLIERAKNELATTHLEPRKQRIAELEQELSRYRAICDLSDRKRLEQQLMNIGEQINYKSFLPVDTRPAIGQGVEFWRSFAEFATDQELAQGVARAKHFAENLLWIDAQGELKQAKRRIAELERQITQTAPPDDTRIAELEQVVQQLQARLNIEERFRTDVQVRHFKAWLKRHPQPQDTDFAKRFLVDTRLPQHASRSMYVAKMRLYGYSAEDIHLFEETWKVMLFEI